MAIENKEPYRTVTAPLPTDSQHLLCDAHLSEEDGIVKAVEHHDAAFTARRVEVRPSADDEIVRQIDVGHVVPHLDRHVDPGLTGWRSVQTLPRLSVVCDAGLHVACLVAAESLVQAARQTPDMS